MIAISMILVHHFLLHAIHPDLIPHLYTILNAFVYSGVNIFFLISGWFGIKLTLKSVINLTGLVFCFTMVNILLCALTGVELSGLGILRFLLFPITGCDYWFIKVYALLMLTSPLVNAGLRSLNPKALSAFTGMFTVFILYSCGIGSNYNNPAGYTYVNALYLYCLAFFLRSNPNLYRRVAQHQCIIGFFVVNALGGFLSALLPHAGLLMKYNGLFTIMSALFLLLFFSRLKFSSRLVNNIAPSALGCYLLQDGMWGFGFFYAFMHDIYTENPLWKAVVYYAGIFVATWVVSMALTTMFKRIIGCVSRYAAGVPLLARPFEMLSGGK